MGLFIRQSQTSGSTNIVWSQCCRVIDCQQLQSDSLCMHVFSRRFFYIYWQSNLITLRTLTWMSKTATPRERMLHLICLRIYKASTNKHWTRSCRAVVTKVFLCSFHHEREDVFKSREQTPAGEFLPGSLPWSVIIILATVPRDSSTMWNID